MEARAAASTSSINPMAERLLGCPASEALETAQNGTYPISRFLYFYTSGTPTATQGTFIGWVVGAEGQKVISDVGYYPLPR